MKAVAYICLGLVFILNLIRFLFSETGYMYFLIITSVVLIGFIYTMFEKQPDDEVCYRGKLVTFRNNVVTIYLENAGKKTYAIEKIISKQWEGCEINDAAFKVILIWERNRDNDPWKCQLKNEADYSIIATLLTAGPYSPPDLADRAE